MATTLSDTAITILAALAIFLAQFIAALVIMLRSQSGTVQKINETMKGTVAEAAKLSVNEAIKAPTQSLSDSAAGIQAALAELIAANRGAINVQQYLTDANARLASKNAELEARVRSSEEKLAAIEKRQEDSIKTVSDLLEDQRKRVEDSKTRDGKIEALGVALKGTNDTLEQTNKDLLAARAELETTKKKLESAEKALADAQARLTDLEGQRDTERALAAQTQAKLEGEINAKNEEIITLKARITTLEGQVKDLQTQLDATTHKDGAP